jgi:hypothetical protein
MRVYRTVMPRARVLVAKFPDMDNKAAEHLRGIRQAAFIVLSLKINIT